MKKLLILMLVFGLASLANATVFDVVAVDIGQSGGRTGGPEDKLEDSDVIGLQIILNNNPYPDWPSYDGYVTDGFNFDLHVTGAGSLGVVMATTKTGDVTDLKHHSGLEFWAESDPLIVGNAIAMLMGGTMGAVDASEDGGGGAGVLVWDLLIHCDGSSSDVVVDLTLAGTTHIWDFKYPSGDPYGDVYDAVEGDLGDLTIYQVPEPATIALLGLGSLFLMRRRRK